MMELSDKIIDCILDNQEGLDTDQILMQLGKVITTVAEQAFKQRNEDNVFIRN